MKLGAWLKQEGKSQAQFAKEIGTDQGNVSEWVHGKVQPSLATVVKVEKLTGGAVDFKDWVTAEPKKRRSKEGKHGD